jgi:hypothetical protein
MKTYTKYGMPLAITESISEVGDDFYEAYDEATEQLMCDREEIQVKEGEGEIIFYDPSLKKSPGRSWSLPARFRRRSSHISDSSISDSSVSGPHRPLRKALKLCLTTSP